MKFYTSIAIFCFSLTLIGCGSPEETTDNPETPEIEEPNVEIPEVETEQVKAEAGVGKEGASLQNETGIGGVIAEPAKQFFNVKQRAVFEFQIPQAVQLFAATNGRKPNSHDEFMEKIIQANQIQLPELKEGQKYVYNPETAELMVERPKQ